MESSNKKFEMYYTAVHMANEESRGEGELNHFDHVANYLYEEAFDIIFDILSEKGDRSILAKMVEENEKKVRKLALKYM